MANEDYPEQSEAAVLRPESALTQNPRYGCRVMSTLFPFRVLVRSKYGQWLINVLILLLSTIILLALCEGLLRWLDGYSLFSPELTPVPPAANDWSAK